MGQEQHGPETACPTGPGLDSRQWVLPEPWSSRGAAQIGAGLEAVAEPHVSFVLLMNRSCFLEQF